MDTRPIRRLDVTYCKVTLKLSRSAAARAALSAPPPRPPLLLVLLLLLLPPTQSVGSGISSVAPGVKAATPGESLPESELGQTTHVGGSRAPGGSKCLGHCKALLRSGSTQPSLPPLPLLLVAPPMLPRALPLLLLFASPEIALHVLHGRAPSIESKSRLLLLPGVVASSVGSLARPAVRGLVSRWSERTKGVQRSRSSQQGVVASEELAKSEERRVEHGMRRLVERV